MLFFAVFVFGASLAFGQQSVLKIGYVNSETVIKELPEAKEAQSKLEGMLKGWQDEIEQRAKSLQSKYEDYQKQANMLNETTKQSKQKELVDEEQKLNQYRQEKQQELAAQREKIMKPIQEKVFKAIAAVAKELKLSFVLDKATDVPVLYADPQYDYTYKVLDNLKRGGK
jgi:outer membrane protein